MIIRNIYRKIYINPFFYIMGLLCVITGLFKAFLVMYLIIFIHELGHITMAIIFKMKIDKISIYPFGGYTEIECDINSSFISECMVFLGGILFQMIFFILSYLILNNDSYTFKLIKSYNLSILLFNMIPIIPLDGSKVINIIMNKLFPFKLSHLITIYISYIVILLFIIYSSKSLNVLLISIMLFIFIIKEHKYHKYLFNTFLLERYIKNIKYKRNNFINKQDIKLLKKYYNNIFIIKNKYISEKQILKKYYKI